MKSLHVLLICTVVTACSQSNQMPSLAFSTDSDSTIYYYNLGWKQIMDEGNYGPAEISYRKALSFDPDFLVGKAVLARLTTSLNERLELYDHIEVGKDKISGDERLILDVYLALVHFTNVREQTPEKSGEVLAKALSLMEQNLAEIAMKHPTEIYLKAEYIEALHSNYGAAATLLALDTLTTGKQKDNPFLIGYAASLNAELGNYEIALETASQLKQVVNNPLIPKPHAVFADIYLRMDSLSQAKEYADKAAKLDPRNLDATRLQSRIADRMAAREK